MAQGVILEPAKDKIVDSELDTKNRLQKENEKDVKVSAHLTETPQVDVRALLAEYKDMFTTVPSITNVSEHVIQLTFCEPIKGRAYLHTCLARDIGPRNRQHDGYGHN